MNLHDASLDASAQRATRAESVPVIGGTSELEHLLADSGAMLSVLPPSVKSQGAGTCLWVHEQRLALIQRFRSSAYGEAGILPGGGAQLGERYALSCDSQNYHLVLARDSGAIIACLRLRVHPPKTTASGLKLFGAIRRMRPSEGVRCSSAINAALLEARPRKLAVGEISEVTVSSQARELPILRVLALAAAGLMRCLGDALVLVKAPAMPAAARLWDEVAQSLYRPLATSGSGGGLSQPESLEILHFDSTRLPAASRSLVDEIRCSLLRSHPHLDGLEAHFEDERAGMADLRRLMAG